MDWSSTRHLLTSAAEFIKKVAISESPVVQAHINGVQLSFPCLLTSAVCSIKTSALYSLSAWEITSRLQIVGT
jgi:hypothetical protein